MIKKDSIFNWNQEEKEAYQLVFIHLSCRLTISLPSSWFTSGQSVIEKNCTILKVVCLPLKNCIEQPNSYPTLRNCTDQDNHPFSGNCIEHASLHCSPKMCRVA